MPNNDLIEKDLGPVTAYAFAVAGGYTGTRAEFEQGLADYFDYMNRAAASAKEAEHWARGTEGGSSVPSTDPSYRQNAKYWADQAASLMNGDISDIVRRATNAVLDTYPAAEAVDF